MNASWDVGLSKTGYIHEAGKCLVMQARVADRPVVIVLLDSAGKLTRVGDANRIRRWMETTLAPQGVRAQRASFESLGAIPG
jgi:D-alanyl-D-alanine endopeptidase (penicillin-binding protein 7)